MGVEFHTYCKEELLEVIDRLPLAIAVIDENRRIVLANKPTYHFVNKNESQLIGRAGGEGFECSNHDDVPEGCGFGQECLKCKLRSTVKDTMENSQPHFMVETSMTFKQHGERHLRITTQPLNFQGNKVVLLSIEDVTEVKAYEQIRIEKEKMAAVFQTAGAVCHEFSQPLQIISGFSELLLDGIAQGDISESNVIRIKEASERLGRLTRKLSNITQYKTKEYLDSKILDIDAASMDKSIQNNAKRV